MGRHRVDPPAADSGQGSDQPTDARTTDARTTKAGNTEAELTEQSSVAMSDHQTAAIPAKELEAIRTAPAPALATPTVSIESETSRTEPGRTESTGSTPAGSTPARSTPAGNTLAGPTPAGNASWHGADGQAEPPATKQRRHGVVATSESVSRSRRRTVTAVGLTLLGVVLLVVGILAFGNTPDDTASGSTAEDSAGRQTSAESAQSSAEIPPRPGTTFSQQPVVLPVTVLNNSPGTQAGLATRVAAALEAGGWPIVDTLNYTETQAGATTAYFTPGNAAEEAAARALVAQFPQIAGGVQPRFDGLPGGGLTVAATGDWVP